MYGPHPDPRNRPRPTWRSVLVRYTVVAAIPLALWIVSRPLTAVLVLASLVALFVTTRWTLRAGRCLRDCGGFALDLGGAVRITVTRTRPDRSC